MCVQLDANLIHAIELDTPHVIALTSSGDVTMTVTLIDARHCPGSVMFLFDGYFGRILYTGDFRYEEGMLDQGPLKELKLNPVDVLYIDNTFCSPKCLLPSRQEAKKQIIDIIEQHPSKRVVFGLRGLGKEDMLISLAKRFDVRIAVTEERYRLLEVPALHEQFVVACKGAKQTRFEVVELVEITRSQVDAWNRSTPTIAILLTGLFVGLGYQPFAGSSDIFVVPLADNSPYAELHEFVAQIRPKSVVPIVRNEPGFNEDPLAASLLDRTNVECFAEHLDHRPMQNYHIPPSVLEMMNHTRHKTTRSRTSNQTSRCTKSVSSIYMSVSTSEPKPSPNSLLLSVFRSTSASSVLATTAVTTVTTSESTSNIVQLNCTNTCNTVTSKIAGKPRVAVRAVKRCLAHEHHLWSPFIKQRQHRWVNFPAPFELQQKRCSASMSELHQKECRWLPAPTCKTKSHMSSVSNKPNVYSAADVLNLKHDNKSYERHRDMSDIAISNVARDQRSRVYHAQPVSGSGDNVGLSTCNNHVGSLRQSSGNAVSTVFPLAELQANTNGVPVPCSFDCDQAGFEHMKKTTALGCALPSIKALSPVSHVRHTQIQILACDADGALNLTTSNTATAQPSLPRVPNPCSSLLNVEHSSDFLQRLHSDSSGLLANVSVQTISDPSLRQVSGAVPAGRTVAGIVSVPCQFLPCNQTQYWYDDNARHGTALKITADTRLVVDDQLSLASVKTESLSKLSQRRVKRSHNVVLPVSATNVNRTEEMSTREEYLPTQLEVGVMLDNYCVPAGDKNTTYAPAMELISLPDVVAFASSNQTREVLQVSAAEHETIAHAVQESNSAPKSTTFANKEGELQFNARVAASTQLISLPPKKKWRKQFRESEVHPRSHQENRQLNVSAVQKLTAK